MPGLPKKPEVAHKYTFPPFPAVPEGVDIIPFKDFEERGISKASLSGIEVDALGVPTVALFKVHDTDRCKTDADPRVNKQVTVIASQDSNSNRILEWWEVWGTEEHTRKVRYDKNMARSDRFKAAIQDFNKNRKWPAAQTNIRAQWDQFQIYVGNISSTQGEKTKQKSVEDEEEDVDDDDDFSDEAELPTGDVPEPHPQPAEDTWEESSMYNGVTDEKEDRMIAFLNDPARSVQVYLSSYMRRQGFHYSERNLFIVPKLLQFFINYLIRNEVLPGKAEAVSLAKALQIIETALTELPFTSKLAQELPDGFNGGLKEAFKVQKATFLWDSSTLTSVDEEEDKAQLVEELVQSNTLEIVDSTGGVWETTPSESDALGWGSAWVNAPDSEVEAGTTNAWGSEDINTPWGSVEDSGLSEIAPEWKIPDPPTLFPLLGPTTLPLTHQTGIVEWSMKRIIKITTPPTTAPAARKSSVITSPDVYGDPEAVEAELTRKLTKVELVPWLGWEDDTTEPEGALPRILEDSKGAVVADEKVVFEWAQTSVAVDASSVYSPSSGLKAYNPLVDPITILVESHIVDHLRVGMGLGGTWVQLLRKGDLIEDGLDVPKKKGKGKERFWYLEDLMITLTSYHVV